MVTRKACILVTSYSSAFVFGSCARPNDPPPNAPAIETPPGATIIFSTYLRPEPYVYGFRMIGDVDFKPTAAGKTVLVVVQGSHPTMRIAAAVEEGVARLASDQRPRSATTKLAFVTQNTNVHRIETGGISGAPRNSFLRIFVFELPDGSPLPQLAPRPLAPYRPNPETSTSNPAN